MLLECIVPLQHLGKETKQVKLQHGVGTLQVFDSVVDYGVRVHRVLCLIGSLDVAGGVGACDVAQGAHGDLQLRACADVEHGRSLVTAVQDGGHAEDGRRARLQRVDVAQVVAIAVLLLVVQVNPAVEARKRVVAVPLADRGVLPSGGGNDARNGLGVAAEPNGAQELFESGHVSAGLACVSAHGSV